MKKWNMIIDVAKCHDCNNCFLACKDEHVENDWPPYSAGPALARPPVDEHHAQGTGAVPHGGCGLSPDAVHALRQRPVHQGGQERRDLQAGQRDRDH